MLCFFKKILFFIPFLLIILYIKPVYAESFSNDKFYVPNYEDSQCVEILDKDTIRVFNDEFTDFYIDYFINSNYISRQGQVDIDYVKNCSDLQFSNIRYYGNDFPLICIIVFSLCAITILPCYLLWKIFYKRS